MSKIATTVKNRAVANANPAAASVSVMLNSMLDSEGYRRRFDELLGKRSPQFVSSIITMVNDNPNMIEAFRNNPLSVVKSALRAATYDLPIDPALGYAYIIPFRNKGRMDATFVLGYKGMIQLALRTGAYNKLNVTDIRKGELKRFNYLTEDMDIDFIEDEEERRALPIVGWAGYFRLVNGTEKTIYMTCGQVEAHEQEHRKGQYMTQVWRDHFDAMASKTVLRELLGKWGIMSIDYQRADNATLAAAEAIATDNWDGEDALINADGEIIHEEAQEAPQAIEPPKESIPFEPDAEAVPLPWDAQEGIK